MVEKQEFASWRHSDIYEELVKFIKEEMQNKATTIINRTSPNGEQDMYIRGAIAAYAAVLEWEPEFPAEDIQDEA